MTEQADVCIIGAGPAGIAAAEVLHHSGLRIIVLDERPTAGGNIHAGAVLGPLRGSARLGPDYARGAAATRAFAQSAIPARYGCSITRIDGKVISYRQNGRVRRIVASRLILATGAMERPVPFPGWERPGVMAAGAFQILLKQSGVVPAQDYVLCGTGPLVLLLADQLLALGSRPKAIIDTNAEASPTRVGLAHPATLLRNAGPVAKGLACMARLRRARVPVISGVTRIEATGAETVDGLRYTRRGGDGGRIAAGMILFHEGIIPNTQLTSALECGLEWNVAQACFAPVLDSFGETSRSGTFVVGDAAGILGATAAPHSGRLAAARIARDLGQLSPTEADRLIATARAALLRERAFRGFLDAAYRPGIATRTPIEDTTTICRCEQVTAAELRQAVRDGARGPAQAKVFTRCGMGVCQGRMCGPAVNRLIAEDTRQGRDAVGGYHIRFPLKPLSLAEMATAPEPEEVAHETAV